MSKKILVTGSSVSKVYLDKLSDAGFEVWNPTHHIAEEDELIEAFQGVSAYLCGGDEYASERVLSSAKELEFISFLGVGYSKFIDAAAATELGIPISNTPGTLDTSVAELTIGLMLDLQRKITYLNNQSKKGVMIHDKVYDLEGLTAGIIGLGSIGRVVARKLVAGFDMNVIHHSRTNKPEIEAELGIKKVPLNELLTQSDVVIILVPQTEETIGMLGAQELALMKPTAYLVNISSSNVVDGHALYQALESEQISAAAFDSYYTPVIDPANDEFKLLSLPDNKFIITPHIGSLTHNARDRMSEKAVNSIISFLTTGDDKYIVNRAGIKAL